MSEAWFGLAQMSNYLPVIGLALLLAILIGLVIGVIQKFLYGDKDG
jgi:hypothetical protein